MHDIVIIGGGPAGMTAALYALRANKSVLVIEKAAFGGQMTFSPNVENFPTVTAASGNALAERMLDQILAQGAEIEIAEVTQVLDEGRTKRVLTDDGGDFPCFAVIIATGVKHRMLGLPGEDELVGNGLSFCAVCDGAFYNGKTVAMVGGGNSALQEAILLSEGCEKVTMLQDLDFFTGEQRLQDILFSKPNVEAVTGVHVEGFELENGEVRGLNIAKTATGEKMHVPCDGFFVAIGLLPENGVFDSLVPLNKFGYVDCGEDCLTGRPGVYAAGDCRSKSVRQITTAAADGAVAALAACRYIDDIK